MYKYQCAGSPTVPTIQPVGGQGAAWQPSTSPSWQPGLTLPQFNPADMAALANAANAANASSSKFFVI